MIYWAVEGKGYGHRVRIYPDQKTWHNRAADICEHHPSRDDVMDEKSEVHWYEGPKGHGQLQNVGFDSFADLEGKIFKMGFVCIGVNKNNLLPPSGA